ncbi:MAG: DNA mismatch repair protein MutS, partial [Spirochaetes bacterium]
FLTTQIEGNNAIDDLITEISRFFPRECIIPESQYNTDSDLIERIKNEIDVTFTPLPDYYFDVEYARETLIEHFNVNSLEGFGCENLPLAISSAGAIVLYLMDTQKTKLSNIRTLRTYFNRKYMMLDSTTIRNLELIQNFRDGSTRGTLLEVLDKTVTSMGSRLLKKWILRPLQNINEINLRLDAVDELTKKTIMRRALRDCIDKIYDLARIISRLNLGRLNPKDVIALKDSLKQVPLIASTIKDAESELLRELRSKLDGLPHLVELIEKAIVPEPPPTIQEGGIIKDGYNEELDELRAISKQGKQWIANYEKEQKQLTKINSLKVKYNQVIGYYIEVTKSNLSNIPKDYIRKQSLSNSERFITTKLKEYEDKVLGAQEKINNLEYEIFVDLRKRLAKEVARIMDTSHILSMIDAITSLAEVAHKYNYCKPKIVTSDELLIEQGRHPVVERLNRNERFVPNDTLMDLDNNQLLIITGPNMAGKSTYIRQVALIVLMAHMGSFVPADKAVIPLVDRIFTRVGASDNLVMGQSTFMVEMKETARILKYATPKSLVILDEIGRGTSTFDGLSIAWAVAEYLIDSPLRRCKTLFATHYHELTQLAELKRGVKNYNVAVREWNDKIIFLRKIVEGGSSRSYGIQVARLAGLPEEVIKRAREILKDLESGELQGFSINKNKKDFSQLSLFESLESNLVKEINSIDISTLTPLEALNKLYELQNKLKNNN